jgi:hypothetical protein
MGGCLGGPARRADPHRLLDRLAPSYDTFGTTMVREKHDIVVVAELMGHQRLETTRSYTLPTTEDRERAITASPATPDGHLKIYGGFLAYPTSYPDGNRCACSGEVNFFIMP